MRPLNLLFVVCYSSLFVCLLFAGLALGKPNQDVYATAGDMDWWKHAVFYQIYPRSFMDSNNDGDGDLQGIIKKLPHLVNLGVTAVWLSPIYKSPMKDNGYDISDFCAIDPMFGTMGDFQQFLKRAHDLGLKVIMDFVPNHTSDEHEWFQNALKCPVFDDKQPECKYRDYYIWADGTGENNDQVPFNWISYFHGPAWTQPKGDKQFYLHQFHVGQPDLNFRNKEVQQEIKDILTFWMDLGVDGFRIDAIPSLVEAEIMKDEELSNYPGCTANDRCYLKNELQTDQDETFEIVYDWRKHLDEYIKKNGGDARVILTESYSPLENVRRYYVDKNDTTRFGAHFSFNFRFITELNAGSDANKIAKVVNEWLEMMNKPEPLTHNWVLGNHDQLRLVSRFGDNLGDGMLMLQMIMPGTAVTYMGEEIAMPNGEVTFEEGNDPQGCDAGKEKYAAQTRDFERTPFQWEDAINAGFNSGWKTWLPVGSSYKTLNVAAQQGVTGSWMEVYKSLLRMRQEIGFTDAALEEITVLEDTKVLQVVRTSKTKKRWTLLMNTSGDEIDVDLAPLTRDNLVYVIASSRNSKLNASDIVPTGQKFKLQPHETVVFST